MMNFPELILFTDEHCCVFWKIPFPRVSQASNVSLKQICEQLLLKATSFDLSFYETIFFGLLDSDRVLQIINMLRYT